MASVDKEGFLPMQEMQKIRFDPWAAKILWSRKWKPTPVFLPGKFHAQKILVGDSPWGCKQSDVIEHAHIPSMF